jgi:hypothetical protein
MGRLIEEFLEVLQQWAKITESDADHNEVVFNAMSYTGGEELYERVGSVDKTTLTPEQWAKTPVGKKGHHTLAQLRDRLIDLVENDGLREDFLGRVLSCGTVGVLSGGGGERGGDDAAVRLAG